MPSKPQSLKLFVPLDAMPQGSFSPRPLRLYSLMGKNFFDRLRERLNNQLSATPALPIELFWECTEGRTLFPGYTRFFTDTHLDAALKKLPTFILADPARSLDFDSKAVFYRRGKMETRKDINRGALPPILPPYIEFNVYEGWDRGGVCRHQVNVIVLYDIPENEFICEYVMNHFTSMFDVAEIFYLLKSYGTDFGQNEQRLENLTNAHRVRLENIMKSRSRFSPDLWDNYLQLAILHEFAQFLWQILPEELKSEWKEKVFSAERDRPQDLIFTRRLLFQLALGEDFASHTFADKLALYFLKPPISFKKLGMVLEQAEIEYIKKVLKYFREKKARCGMIFRLPDGRYYSGDETGD